MDTVKRAVMAARKVAKKTRKTDRREARKVAARNLANASQHVRLAALDHERAEQRSRDAAHRAASAKYDPTADADTIARLGLAAAECVEALTRAKSALGQAETERDECERKCRELAPSVVARDHGRSRP